VPIGTSPYLSPSRSRATAAIPAATFFRSRDALLPADGRASLRLSAQAKRLAKRLWRDPTPSSLNPKCPPWLQEVILHCLEPEAENRIQTAAQLALDLANPDQIVLTERAENSAAIPGSRRGGAGGRKSSGRSVLHAAWRRGVERRRSFWRRSTWRWRMRAGRIHPRGASRLMTTAPGARSPASR